MLSVVKLLSALHDSINKVPLKQTKYKLFKKITTNLSLCLVRHKPLLLIAWKEAFPWIRDRRTIPVLWGLLDPCWNTCRMPDGRRTPRHPRSRPIVGTWRTGLGFLDWARDNTGLLGQSSTLCKSLCLEIPWRFSAGWVCACIRKSWWIWRQVLDSLSTTPLGNIRTLAPNIPSENIFLRNSKYFGNWELPQNKWIGIPASSCLCLQSKHQLDPWIWASCT